MSSNYDGVSGVEVSVWPDDHDDAEPAEAFHAKIEELYFEERNGQVNLTFIDRESGDFYDVTIPVKARPDWNGFVGSLPTWEL